MSRRRRQRKAQRLEPAHRPSARRIHSSEAERPLSNLVETRSEIAVAEGAGEVGVQTLDGNHDHIGFDVRQLIAIDDAPSDIGIIFKGGIVDGQKRSQPSEHFVVVVRQIERLIVELVGEKRSDKFISAVARQLDVMTVVADFFSPIGLNNHGEDQRQQNDRGGSDQFFFDVD